MSGTIQEPVKGGSISSLTPWAQSVTRTVNALVPFSSPGMLHRSGPAGFGGEPLPASHRARPSAASAVDNGCWKIVSGTREEEGENEGETEEKPVRVFANQYYLNGEVLHELALEAAVEDFVCQGELDEGEEYTAADKPFVALKIPATTPSTEVPALVGYKTLVALQTAQSDVARVVMPLYKFTHDGTVAVDFRNAPQAQVVEILS